MVRNSGKFGKPKRGGGKHFTNARVLSAQNNETEGMWGDKRDKDEDDDSEDDEDEDEESGSDSDDGLGGSMRAGPSSSSRVAFASAISSSQQPQTSSTEPALKPGDIDKFGNVVQEPEMTKREAKRAAKAKEAAKAQQGKQAADSEEESESSDEDPLLQAGSANKTLNKQMKMSSLSDTVKKPAAAPQPMNRKEREEAAKKAARERYLEMHRAGKTDEARADLARLAKIRKEREEAAQRKAAEKASAEQAKADALAKSGRKR